MRPTEFSFIGVLVDVGFAIMAFTGVILVFRPERIMWTGGAIVATALVLIAFFALLWLLAGMYPDLIVFLAFTYVNLAALTTVGYVCGQKFLKKYREAGEE